MATFELQGPDGQTYDVEAPDDATPEQVYAIFQGQSAPSPSALENLGNDAGAFNAFAYGLNSAVPFGNKASSALGALGALAASPITGDPRGFGELYAQAQDDTNYTADQNPKSYIGGALAGIGSTLPLASGRVLAAPEILPQLARGTVNAIPGALSSIGNFARGGTSVASNAARGAVVAAPAFAAYGAGEAPIGEELQGAQSGAMLGAGVGAALPVLGAGATALNIKVVVPTADEVRAAGSRLFKQADSVGGVLKPQVTNDFVDAIENLRPQTEIGKAVNGTTPFTELVDRIATIRDKPLSLQAAQEVDESLGTAINAMKNPDGTLTKEGNKLFNVQTQLRKTIEDADENLVDGGKEGFQALKEARRLWSTSLKMRDIEKIIENADTFQVPATAIKTGFRQIIRNPKRFSQYSKDEQKALKLAAQTGIGTDILNIVGSRLGAIGAGVTGGADAGIGAFALGSTARNLAAKQQGEKAAKALEEVAKKSGMVSTQQRIDTTKIKGLLK